MSTVADADTGRLVAIVIKPAGALELRRAWVDRPHVAVVESWTDVPAEAVVIAIGERPQDEARSPAYLARASLPDPQLRALVEALSSGLALPGPAVRVPAEAEEARSAHIAFTKSRRLAAVPDLLAMEHILQDAILELAQADRAYCWFFDPEDRTLWSEESVRTTGITQPASLGLVGWAAITGLGARAACGEDDPRWHRSVDDPDGETDSQILIQPICGANRHVHAVLVAVRRSRRRAFGPVTTDLLARFAALAAPFLDQLSVHMTAEHVISEADGAGVFRHDALDAARNPSLGDTLRITPRWVSPAYWCLVLALIGGLALLVLGRLRTYSSGAAVVRALKRSPISARSKGVITSLRVQPGDRVKSGDLIATLDDAEQHEAVDQLTNEFNVSLRNHLLDLSNPGAESSLRALRLQLAQGRAALESRRIRSGVDGTVSDVRVRTGQPIEIGEIAVSIADRDEQLEMIALMPGEDRPQLVPGMTVRLQLAGYRHASQDLIIDRISSDVVAAGEAKRMLGPDAPDLRIDGPVVIIHAHLPAAEFVIDDQALRYHDGMVGTAVVPLRTERAIHSLWPGLRRL